MLTPKREKFCRLMAEGKDQSTAYRLSYDIGNMKPETIHNNAYMLKQKSEIKARIAEIKEELRLASIITFERQLRLIEKAMEKCLEIGDLTNYYKGLDMQNKLLALYTTKIEQKTNLQHLNKNGEPTNPPNLTIIDSL